MWTRDRLLNDDIHVVPVKDLREHLYEDCWCKPTINEGVVVHNSLDGRELMEEQEEGH